MVPFIGNFQNMQIYRDGKYPIGCEGLAGGMNGEE